LPSLRTTHGKSDIQFQAWHRHLRFRPLGILGQSPVRCVVVSKNERYVPLILATERALISSVVLQRVKSASVTVDGKLIASIGKGILAFAAVSKDDTLNDSLKSASRLLKMKLWEDDKGIKVCPTSSTTARLD
jgi:hypothetical protein